jgi:hypothetical protein
MPMPSVIHYISFANIYIIHTFSHQMKHSGKRRRLLEGNVIKLQTFYPQGSRIPHSSTFAVFSEITDGFL